MQTPSASVPPGLSPQQARELVAINAILEMRGEPLVLAPAQEKTEPLPGSELHWEKWLAKSYPHVANKPLAERMTRLWEWFDALTPGVLPRPRVECWPRGGAKSATAELGCVRVGVKLSRRFVLYVSETQDQANLHVQAIGSLFEHIGIERAVNRYGASKGWRRDQLRTAHGYNVAAFGLDVAARGVRLDNYRPDLIILDDIDSRHDTEATTEKKIQTITQSLMPAGSTDCAILFVQNMVHRGGVMAQVVGNKADFLANREPPIVEPAVIDLQYVGEQQPDGTYRYRVTGGTPTWAGQDLAVCEHQINTWGPSAFLREAQQQVDEEEGGLWNREILKRARVTKHPPLTRIVVAVDPNTSEGNDEAGIIVAGIATVNGVVHGYVLEDATVGGGPKQWAEAAVAAYHRHRADVVVAEANNGGEMVALTIASVDGAPKVKLVHASRGKITRAEPVQKLYDDGRFHHVGHFPQLETELCTYRAGMPSPNRLDACVWAATELMVEIPRSRKVVSLW